MLNPRCAHLKQKIIIVQTRGEKYPGRIEQLPRANRSLFWIAKKLLSIIFIPPLISIDFMRGFQCWHRSNKNCRIKAELKNTRKQTFSLGYVYTQCTAKVNPNRETYNRFLRFETLPYVFRAVYIDGLYEEIKYLPLNSLEREYYHLNVMNWKIPPITRKSNFSDQKYIHRFCRSENMTNAIMYLLYIPCFEFCRCPYYTKVIFLSISTPISGIFDSKIKRDRCVWNTDKFYPIDFIYWCGEPSLNNADRL